jgi:hypothetical protein
LVANQKRRSELISLAHEITGFEINQQILPTPIFLTPHCLFVRGMELHLRQQFEDALKYWDQVALRDDSSDELKSLTWYWIGTEQNNWEISARRSKVSIVRGGQHQRRETSNSSGSVSSRASSIRSERQLSLLFDHWRSCFSRQRGWAIRRKWKCARSRF